MSDHQITLPKANILVVDDAPANLRLLAGILTEQGYTVQPALALVARLYQLPKG